MNRTTGDSGDESFEHLGTLADGLPSRPQVTGPEGTVPGSSDFFRRYWLEPENDLEHHVIHRTELGFLVLNRYPYANGHLLAALGTAAPTLLEYDQDHRAAFWSLVEDGCRLVRHALNPQGVNIGANIGDAAGAGVPEHLHAHVVPRWAGDTNFMSVVGTIRVAPDSLESVADLYRESIAQGALRAD